MGILPAFVELPEKFSNRFVDESIEAIGYNIRNGYFDQCHDIINQLVELREQSRLEDDVAQMSDIVAVESGGRIICIMSRMFSDRNALIDYLTIGCHEVRGLQHVGKLIEALSINAKSSNTSPYGWAIAAHKIMSVGLTRDHKLRVLSPLEFAQIRADRNSYIHYLDLPHDIAMYVNSGKVETSYDYDQPEVD